MKHVLMFVVFLALSPVAAAAAEDAIDFNRDIRPILTNNCFACHGPDDKERKGGLRLDTRDGALADLDGSHAVVPGKPDQSELLKRVAMDGFRRMPPRKKGKKLSAKEIELLTRWVKQGAPYPRHWAYVKPKRPDLPVVKSKAWPRNAIDYFVLSRLEKAGLSPSPAADRYALIRRVSLDLTGLPPTPEEVDRFINDKSPDAYEKVVDRLLASSAYGERWARVWLDLARYADSAGYAQDPPRTIWRYRDWVIQAINQNMPYDQFTVEQLAGDMLANPTLDQRIATAFHRNTMTNSEGGTNDEEFRNAAVVDRVNTTMQVWMGMTMGCAQCHNHKYDPISQEEYFQFFAIFNQSADADRGNEAPVLTSFTEAQKKERARLQAEIARLEKIIAAQPKLKAPKPKTLPDGPLLARYIRVELPGKGVYLSLAEVQAFVGGKNIATTGKARQVSTAYEGPAKLAIDGNTNGDYFAAKSTTHTNKANTPWWEVDLVKPQVLERIAVWNRTDGGTGNRLRQFRVIALNEKREPIWVRTIAKPPSPSVKLDLPKSTRQLTKQDRAEINRYRAGKGPAATKEQAQLAALKKKLAGMKGVTTPIMEELPANRRRKTSIQIRGNFLEKGKEVTAGVPAAFHGWPKGLEINRLNLARWLVHEDNPLTARVTVNRYWEQLFGVGLVETSEDFGLQGEPPSHPLLLDYLATELMKQKWDVKKFLKLIVTSAAYRQSTRVTPELLQRDPHNRLLARGPRFRLPAEMIRDQALAVSGLLSRKMYGPSVRPPRPVLGLKAAFGGSTDWKPSPGEDRYRRGLYTSWRRTTPYPSMMTFDATSREVCTIRRIRTNTPLQALVTLNDPVYIEAAQAVARRIVARGGSSAKERATYGFKLCLARPPSDKELDRIVQLFETTRKRYAQDEKQAALMATDPLGPAPKGASIADLAAWTVVGNVLLNLDEFLARR